MRRSNDPNGYSDDARRLALVAVLATLLAQGGATGAAAGDLTPPATGVLDFDIVRNDAVIGHYHSAFTAGSDHALQVRTHVAVAVTMGPIRLYSFDHDSVETWRDERLVGLVAETDDDGDVHHLRAEGRDQGLVLTVDGDTRLAAGDAVPSSLWSRSMLNGHRPIFDIGDGQIFQTQIHCDDPLQAAARRLTTCQISGDLTRTLRFDPDGLLAGLTFPAEDGSKVTYRPK